MEKSHFRWTNFWGAGQNNIYSNRQAVAHGSGAQMSFGDLTKNYQESLVVLDELVSALNLRPKEIHDLK
jgi:hypothetical protein